MRFALGVHWTSPRRWIWRAARLDAVKVVVRMSDK
ncbi:hypothetical protein NK6_1135 [Bradyrhizobium diazoefficiens]|uniref:Uncharacterized protein n=1 Tax=Bradyrhizobium diazoefficiens TaxID=1355477 RepID=A0A0E3VSQ5_9BRAD|nr:hypothetical protein NK6_1135 [Bradyrhizobium diazoefficiens]